MRHNLSRREFEQELEAFIVDMRAKAYEFFDAGVAPASALSCGIDLAKVLALRRAEERVKAILGSSSAARGN